MGINWNRKFQNKNHSINISEWMFISSSLETDKMKVSALNLQASVLSSSKRLNSPNFALMEISFYISYAFYFIIRACNYETKNLSRFVMRYSYFQAMLVTGYPGRKTWSEVLSRWCMAYLFQLIFIPARIPDNEGCSRDPWSNAAAIHTVSHTPLIPTHAQGVNHHAERRVLFYLDYM